MEIITVDNVEYHANPIYKQTSDNESEEIIGFDPILNENGEMIPAYICICAAREKFECCCGAWDRPLPSEENY